MSKNNENQTEFQAVHPIFENELMGSVDTAVRAEREADVKKIALIKKPKFLLLIFIATLTISFLILLLFSTSLKKNIEQITKPVDPDKPSSSVERTEFEQQIDLLIEQLQEADPAKNTLPYPPLEVDLGV